MLTQITRTLWIDLSDIYYVDTDRDSLESTELMVFIRLHAKFPIIIKDQEAINYFLQCLDAYNQEKLHEKYSRPQDVTQTSQITMEQLNPSTESTNERDAGQTQSW